MMTSSFSVLMSLFEQYQRQYAGLIKRVPLIENQGLGAALRVGIPECNYELIARMDTDDIARRDRFEKQIAEFENNPNLDVCGSQIDEFEETPDKIIARRSVLLEHNDIVQYLKRRDAFIHVTVMFKKRAVLKADNYQPCSLMEDSFLWARMIQSGAECMNLPESLVSV